MTSKKAAAPIELDEASRAAILASAEHIEGKHIGWIIEAAKAEFARALLENENELLRIQLLGSDDDGKEIPRFTDGGSYVLDHKKRVLELKRQVNTKRHLLVFLDALSANKSCLLVMLQELTGAQMRRLTSKILKSIATVSAGDKAELCQHPTGQTS